MVSVARPSRWVLGSEGGARGAEGERLRQGRVGSTQVVTGLSSTLPRPQDVDEGRSTGHSGWRRVVWTVDKDRR